MVGLASRSATKHAACWCGILPTAREKLSRSLLTPGRSSQRRSNSLRERSPVREGRVVPLGVGVRFCARAGARTVFGGGRAAKWCFLAAGDVPGAVVSGGRGVLPGAAVRAV